MRMKVLSVFCAFFSVSAFPAASDIPESAQGTFVQRKILSDVDVTLVSRGNFRFEKGRFFEWKVTSPVPSVFYATPTNWSFTAGKRTTTRSLDVDVSSFAGIFKVKEMKEFVDGVKVFPTNCFPEKVNVSFKNGDRLEIEMVQNR